MVSVLQFWSKLPQLFIISLFFMASTSPATEAKKNSSTGNDTVPPNPSQNPSSPYYLHPGENPGYVLVSPPLNEDNYYNWSKAMIHALSSKNKLKFVNGIIKKSAADDPLYEAWERCNHIIVSWITRTLAPNISQSSASFDNAHDLWLHLKEKITKGNHSRMSDLLHELHSMKQGDRSLSTYFRDMKIL